MIFSITIIIFNKINRQMTLLNEKSPVKAEEQKQSDTRLPKTTVVHQNSEPSSQRLSIKKSKSCNQYRKNQRWSNVQKNRYISFLRKNPNLFDLSFEEKRKAKINVKMSKVVKSKNPSQCHSHHQKMMIKYGSVASIINENVYQTKQVGLFNKKSRLSASTEDLMQQAQDAHKIQPQQRIQSIILDESQCWKYLECFIFQHPETPIQGGEQ